MEEVRLGMMEAQFAEIVWEKAPMTTRELVDVCAEKLNWKRTTTYTVLKKLCLRGILAMENSIVTVLINKEQFKTIRTQQFVGEYFQGSLPAFIAAFTAQKAPSEKELAQIKEMIRSFEEQQK